MVKNQKGYPSIYRQNQIKPSHWGAAWSGVDRSSEGWFGIESWPPLSGTVWSFLKKISITRIYLLFFLLGYLKKKKALVRWYPLADITFS